jgi:dipeptidyl aminopeptidase/acylaminoacyl peptidase
MARILDPVRATLVVAALVAVPGRAQSQAHPVDKFVTFPFPTELVASATGDRIAWVLDDRGARNVWGASGPSWEPKQLTTFTKDDGQALTQLSFTADGSQLVFVRGGDHGSNWASPGGVEPNPTSDPKRTQVELWTVAWTGGGGRMLTTGDEPAVSPKGDRVAYIKDGQVWTVPLAAGGKAEPLFYSRGRSQELAWSPDGSALAFVSNRPGGYGLLGIYTAPDTPIRWLAPEVDRPSSPVWSPDGKEIAYVNEPGRGGPPETMLERHPRPWALRVADVASGKVRTVWSSPNTQLGSRPRTQGGVNLAWGTGGRLVFIANLDNWPHLYSVSTTGGGAPLLLTAGNFMVEFVSMSPDRKFIVYNANTGTDPADDDRRHLYRVPVDAAQPVALTKGVDLEWSPVVTGDGRTIALLTSGVRRPPLPAVMPVDGGQVRLLGADRIPSDFPASALVTPEKVVIPSLDGIPIHLQVFQTKGGAGKRPAAIYVHGGPPRQMLLGFHYWHYYASDYALNQYLANQGFVVASVNYRLGIGYGDRFMNPDNSGAMGASEYQDVLAAVKWLAKQPNVDPSRIGIWGGSYGGYLTALGLARNSDLFAAGVDIHGVHDRTAGFADRMRTLQTGYEKPADLDKALEVMWKSSPVADMATWKSPVLLIHGDDDRNVQVSQTVDLAQRLRTQGVRFEQLLIPDEIHDFLRYHTWVTVSRAASDFLNKELNPQRP